MSLILLDKGQVFFLKNYNKKPNLCVNKYKIIVRILTRQPEAETPQPLGQKSMYV
jgi:hypothetical protein